MRILNLLGISTALIVSFGAGAVTAVFRHWGQPLATVHVRNVSELEVSKVVLISKTWKSTTTSELGPLVTGAQTTYMIFMAGEGSYQLRATLADGRVLEGGAGYVEAGYTNNELVHSDRIESRSGFGV